MLRRMKSLRCWIACIGMSWGGLAGAQSLEQIVADPQLWPAQVTVVGAARGTVIKDGKPAGIMLVGAGTKLAVTAIAADGVTGKVGAATVRVPVEKTNLLGQPAVASAPAIAAPVEPAMPAPAAASAPSAPAKAGGSNAMQRLLGGKLVRLANNRLEPVAAEQLAGVKYYGLYYSASWCGPCRQFTPRFVNAYRQLKQAHPEFEVVFVSADRSAGDMADYMKEDQMPWLAVKYDQRTEKITSYSGSGIPCLVLVDAKGQVLSDSFEGDNYVGPGKVLQDAQRILREGRL